MRTPADLRRLADQTKETADQASDLGKAAILRLQGIILEELADVNELVRAHTPAGG